jgi:hypothetical protein
MGVANGHGNPIGVSGGEREVRQLNAGLQYHVLVAALGKIGPLIIAFDSMGAATSSLSPIISALFYAL